MADVVPVVGAADAPASGEAAAVVIDIGDAAIRLGRGEPEDDVRSSLPAARRQERMSLHAGNIIQDEEGPVERLALDELVRSGGMRKADRPASRHFRLILKADLVIVAEQYLDGDDVVLYFLLRQHGERGHVALFVQVFCNFAGNLPKVGNGNILFDIRGYQCLQICLGYVRGSDEPDLVHMDLDFCPFACRLAKIHLDIRLIGLWLPLTILIDSSSY